MNTPKFIRYIGDRQLKDVSSAQRIIRAAFDDFNLNELIAVTSTDNSVSQSLLLRLGLTFRGVEKWMGTEEDVYIYELNSGTNENINL